MTKYTDFQWADGRVHIVLVDEANIVQSVAKLPIDAVGGYLGVFPEAILLAPDEAAKIDTAHRWSLRDGVVSQIPDPVTPLAKLIAEAQARVDQAAERARLLFITPGSGQALEYQATSDDAQKLLAATGTSDPTDYPWLVAEQHAQAALGPTASLATVAAQVIAQTAAWATVGSAIKETRRAAKLRLAAATDAVQIASIEQGAVWPHP
jgi:hypothetical protein